MKPVEIDVPRPVNPVEIDVLRPVNPVEIDVLRPVNPVVVKPDIIDKPCAEYTLYQLGNLQGKTMDFKRNSRTWTKFRKSYDENGNI